MNSLLTLTLLVAITNLSACANSAVSEVQTWKNSACACTTRECAEQQGDAFWKLAAKFRDESPTKNEAKKLDRLANEGQECLEKMAVDVYQLRT